MLYLTFSEPIGQISVVPVPVVVCQILFSIRTSGPSLLKFFKFEIEAGF